jgi:hypothetical protein
VTHLKLINLLQMHNCCTLVSAAAAQTDMAKTSVDNAGSASTLSGAMQGTLPCIAAVELEQLAHYASLCFFTCFLLSNCF